LPKNNSGKGLSPLKNERKSEHISKIILKYIEHNKLEPGQKLPSENELSKTLNVSTRSIREAFKILEARGFIEIMHGKGAFYIDRGYYKYIESLTASLNFNQKKDSILLNLNEVRKIIETAIIEKVAVRRTDEDITKLRDIIEKLVSSVKKHDIDSYNYYDAAFHKAIIDCSDNEILSIFYDGLLSMLLESFRMTGYAYVNTEESAENHSRMFQAIERRNPQEARRLVEEQLNKTEATLMRLIAEDKLQEDAEAGDTATP
jgi:GntR family transcriptional regulator, transcriptional repressor for pyruvate dehydrogenase complex